MVHELSTHGEMCIYHVDLPPEHDMMVTDLAIMNTSTRLRPKAVVRVTAGVVTSARYPMTAIPG